MSKKKPVCKVCNNEIKTINVSSLSLAKENEKPIKSKYKFCSIDCHNKQTSKQYDNLTQMTNLHNELQKSINPFAEMIKNVIPQKMAWLELQDNLNPILSQIEQSNTLATNVIQSMNLDLFKTAYSNLFDSLTMFKENQTLAYFEDLKEDLKELQKEKKAFLNNPFYEDTQNELKQKDKELKQKENEKQALQETINKLMQEHTNQLIKATLQTVTETESNIKEVSYLAPKQYILLMHYYKDKKIVNFGVSSFIDEVKFLFTFKGQKIPTDIRSHTFYKYWKQANDTDSRYDNLLTKKNLYKLLDYAKVLDSLLLINEIQKDIETLP